MKTNNNQKESPNENAKGKSKRSGTRVGLRPTKSNHTILIYIYIYSFLIFHVYIYKYMHYNYIYIYNASGGATQWYGPFQVYLSCRHLRIHVAQWLGTVRRWATHGFCSTQRLRSFFQVLMYF